MESCQLWPLESWGGVACRCRRRWGSSNRARQKGLACGTRSSAAGRGPRRRGPGRHRGWAAVAVRPSQRTYGVAKFGECAGREISQSTPLGRPRDVRDTEGESGRRYREACEDGDSRGHGARRRSNIKTLHSPPHVQASPLAIKGGRSWGLLRADARICKR